MLTSLGIFAGLIAIKLTGWTILDPVFAILVALFILKAAAELTIKSVRDLMDVNLPEEEVAEIQSIIKDHSGKFAGFHELRTRRSGSDRFIDLHMVVSRDMSVEQSHRLVDHIEKDITARFPRTSVITHVEPCDNDEYARAARLKSAASTWRQWKSPDADKVLLFSLFDMAGVDNSAMAGYGKKALVIETRAWASAGRAGLYPAVA